MDKISKLKPKFGFLGKSSKLIFFFKLGVYFFRAVLGSYQNREGGMEISHVPPAPAHSQPPSLSTSPQRRTWVKADESPWRRVITQSNRSYQGSRFVLYILLDKCMVTETLIVQSSFFVLKSSVPHLFIPPSPS